MLGSRAEMNHTKCKYQILAWLQNFRPMPAESAPTTVQPSPCWPPGSKNTITNTKFTTQIQWLQTAELKHPASTILRSRLRVTPLFWNSNAPRVHYGPYGSFTVWHLLTLKTAATLLYVSYGLGLELAG